MRREETETKETGKEKHKRRSSVLDVLNEKTELERARSASRPSSPDGEAIPDNRTSVLSGLTYTSYSNTNHNNVNDASSAASSADDGTGGSEMVHVYGTVALQHGAHAHQHLFGTVAE